MPDIDRADWIAFLRGEHDSPGRADLLTRSWMGTEAQRRARLAEWACWATRYPWGWEGMRRLYLHLRRTGEPVPRELHEWIDRNVVDGNGPPGLGRSGRPAKNDDRDLRIWVTVRALTGMGCTRERAWELCADALDVEPDSIRSVMRKQDRERCAMQEHAREYRQAAGKNPT